MCTIFCVKFICRITPYQSTALRGKQRKMAYLSDLESKAERLQQETKSLSARVESVKVCKSNSSRPCKNWIRKTCLQVKNMRGRAEPLSKPA